MAGFAPHWRWARGPARNGKRQGVPEKLTDHLVHWFENPLRVLIVVLLLQKSIAVELLANSNARKQ